MPFHSVVASQDMHQATGKKEGHPCKGMACTLLAFIEAERSVWLFGLSDQSGSF
ncbi:hypothetical protein Syncc8109_1441 [Synechococcus sp. WH 8109]|nr:hypothetical protein Syncc8109_1441 [Synechococcus sp. WH 8109]